MIQIPLVLKDGRISQLPVGDTVSGTGLPDGSKFEFMMAALAAFDKVSSITYLDTGLKSQRINTVTCTSALYPGSDVVKTVFYLDAGNVNQRIEKVEYAGAIFGSDTLTKTFSYSLVGNKYKVDSMTWSLV